MTSTAFAWRKVAQLGPFSPGLLAPARAARVTFGVVLPLVVGWQSGHIDYGAYMALGALPAGITSFQGAARSRVAAVLLASAGMALSTFVGATAAASAPWLLVPMVAVWAYLTGLSVSLGPRWSVAVLQWSVALLIGMGLPQGPSEAALRAGLVLAGGLLQTILVAIAWTLRPGRAERAAFAASYRGLAKYASDVAQGTLGPPPPMSFPARAAVEDPNPLLANLRLLYIDLVEETERLRASLAALAAHVRQHPGDGGDLRAFMAQAAAVLTQLADAPAMARADRGIALTDLAQRLAHLTIADNATWRWSGEALLGQLRAVARMIAELDAPSASAAGTYATDAAASPRRPGEFARALATFRANVTTTSEAGRHALRLALVAMFTEAFVQATGLYQGRWATLTIFMVLKPDYASTLYRGSQRALGTVMGAAAGALAIELAHHSHGAWVAAAGIAIAIAYAVFDASYLLFSVFLTMFIVVLLVMMGMPAVSTAEARIYETFLGAAFALAAYMAWPTWERTTAAAKFAQLAYAHREYATALLEAFSRPGSVDSAKMRTLQLAAGRTRSDAEAAATRLADEPAGGHFTPEIAQLLVAAVSRLAHAELALHALALTRDPQVAAGDVRREGPAPIDELKTAVADALSRIALGLRTLSAPGPIPALRPIYSKLSADPILRDTALVPIVDELIDAVNTLEAVLRDRLPA
jgi:uncharacterized membrane protein YccC